MNDDNGTAMVSAAISTSGNSPERGYDERYIKESIYLQDHDESVALSAASQQQQQQRKQKR
jgi:hypothetical protein